MRPGGPESLREERKEAPQITVIESIYRNVEVVEIDGTRRYRVTWKAGTAGVERAEAKREKPAVCYFDTAEQVINQHERVLEGYLGTEIPLAANQISQIPGETQKMAKISAALSSLAGQLVIPLTSDASLALKKRIPKIRNEIGAVTNVYKQKAQAELEKAALSEEERERTQAVLAANLAVLKRTAECLGIVGGTASRLRVVTQVKNGWEETMVKTFYELAAIYNDVGKGVYDGHPRKREQLARHISGGSEWSLAGKLNQIPGPEYWQRIQTSDVRGLWQVGGFLREEDDEKAKKLLAAAILKLERVVKERKEGKLTPAQTGV